MSRTYRCLIILFVIMIFLCGCAPKDENKNQATPTPTSAKGQTAKPSDNPAYDRLDKLNSYALLMTVVPQGGSAVGTKQKYEVVHFSDVPARSVVRYMAQGQKDFTIAEESVQIGDKQWVKEYGKQWVVGISRTTTAYSIEIVMLYLALKNGKLKRIDEVTVSGVKTKHYSFDYTTTGTKATGEVWIANESDLPKVPVKALGEQSAIDAEGNVVKDYRHLKYDFEISQINQAPAVKPPV